MVTNRFSVELEPEVQNWLSGLPVSHYLIAEEKVDRLADQPTDLGEPHSRCLGDGLRELRFSLSGAAIRVTYWLAPGRRIVLLTVFRKSRMREDLVCEAWHGPAQVVYTRHDKPQA
ncbi:hypothetical protein GCM10023205_71890 [Yinghuangia aomiensis]|uniref:Type II toxin-antitoxin system RelE/ParE family toxin n=1 Tax=Yinghuangia aomiensis TaxID=676205 RepID=A0ABP9I6R7_9ACTN